MKLKNKINLYKDVSCTDSKNKLNRLNKTVNTDILHKIENGITIEDLDNIVSQQMPVFKYQTQITIHGLFDELGNNYVYGYKNIFQNKNKSIGIKYNAIDEEKRQRIKEKLKYANFGYNRNSQDTGFVYMIRVIDGNELQEVVKEVTNIYNKIDTSLIGGGKQMYHGNYFGMTYIIIELSINYIYEKNIEKFVNKIISNKEIQAKKQEDEKREREQKKEFEKRQAERQEYKNKELKKHEKKIDYLNQNYKTYKGEPRPGRYIKLTFNYHNILTFIAMYVYKPAGKRICKCNTADFTNLSEAQTFLKNAKPDIFDIKLKYIKEAYLIEDNTTPAPKPDKNKKIKCKTSEIKIVDYSSKAIAVIGNTKPIKEDLKNIGGKFNFRLKCGPGWIFSKHKKDKVQETLNVISQ